MRRVLRFLWVFFLSAGAISFVGRIVSDFDEPDDPHDLIRGIGVCLTAVLIAGLDQLRLRKRRAV